MKKISIIATLFILTLFAAPTYAATNPANDTEKTEEVKPLTKEEAETMLSRINEIKDMDKSELSREERKELRKEVRSIKKEMRERDSGGLYISSGAIIIILLLIIIL